MKKIFVDIPKKYIKSVDEEAKRLGTTRNELIMRAIRLSYLPKKAIGAGRRER